jgi:hypothetical protein
MFLVLTQRDAKAKHCARRECRASAASDRLREGGHGCWGRYGVVVKGLVVAGPGQLGGLLNFYHRGEKRQVA